MKKFLFLVLCVLLAFSAAGCSENSPKNNEIPGRDQVRVWYEQTFEDEYTDYQFADYTDMWKYSDNNDSLILRNKINMTYDECVLSGESIYESLISEMKSDAIEIGSKAREEFKYNNLAVRIHLISSDEKLLCTVSETGYRLDDFSPPIWGYK